MSSTNIMQLLAVSLVIGGIVGWIGVRMLGRRRSADDLPVDRHRPRKQHDRADYNDGGGNDGD
ncbi:MAG: hypothetical protein ACJ8GV_09500 [Luteimonas sp.]